VAILGVLFDWRGTLVRDPDDEWWLRTALSRLGRQVSDAEIHDVVDRLRAAQERPDVVAARVGADCSAERHRDAATVLFGAAGLDRELSDVLYGLDFEPAAHPLYEDVPGTLTRLKALGVAVAVVSDIHFDLRPEFAWLGLDAMVDYFALSFEHGIEKPDPRIFLRAVEALGIEPGETLMVGDRPGRDGGAVDAGITTLLLPAGNGPTRGLDAVVALVRSSGSAASSGPGPWRRHEQ